MASSDNSQCSTCAYAAASFLLRMWIGLRLIFAGLDKFRKGDSYSIENYNEKMGLIAQTVTDNSFLPGWAGKLYSMPLGYLLVVVGVWVLLGIFRTSALFAAGLLFLSLAFGVMVLPDDMQALMLGVHVGIVAAALGMVQYDCFTLDRLFRWKKD